MKMPHLALAEDLALAFVALDEVEAVALGGSRANVAVAPDVSSDIDLYVYTRRYLGIDRRRSVMDAAGGATRANIGLEKSVALPVSIRLR
jgi:predicted nucleotidyltransferase